MSQTLQAQGTRCAWWAAMDILCSEAADILVELGTQSKTFKFVAFTQSEAPIQHRHMQVGDGDALVANLNIGHGTRLVNQTSL